jgi:hypothetical protein
MPGVVVGPRVGEPDCRGDLGDGVPGRGSLRRRTLRARRAVAPRRPRRPRARCGSLPADPRDLDARSPRRRSPPAPTGHPSSTRDRVVCPTLRTQHACAHVRRATLRGRPLPARSGLRARHPDSHRQPHAVPEGERARDRSGRARAAHRRAARPAPPGRRRRPGAGHPRPPGRNGRLPLPTATSAVASLSPPTTRSLNCATP